MANRQQKHDQKMRVRFYFVLFCKNRIDVVLLFLCKKNEYETCWFVYISRLAREEWGENWLEQGKEFVSGRGGGGGGDVGRITCP